MIKLIMRIEWKDEYNLGIKEIDEQHQKFFEILASANDILLLEKHTSDQEKIIKEMFDYADYHFSTEEKYFEKFDYSEKDTHEKEHDEYRRKTLDFHKKISTEKDVYTEMIDFIYGWWVGHILNTDRKYIKNFHNNGL